MIECWNVTIPEFTGDEERRAYIYLPDYYEEDEEDRFPVLYMFDGHNLFFDEDSTYGETWHLGEFMEESELPLIVVAVECNHDPDNGRLIEYSPFNFFDPDVGYINGRGRETMEWFVNELKPSIDETYRTNPDREHTFIAGSSMGGLMSLYALMEYNEVFSGAAALSPSIWTSPRLVKRMIRRANLVGETTLYMDYGSEEMGFRQEVCDMPKVFGQVASMLIQKGVFLTSRIVPHGQHTENSWEVQTPYFMETLMYSFMNEDKE